MKQEIGKCDKRFSVSGMGVANRQHTVVFDFDTALPAGLIHENLQ